ncbi:T9SS type A sorting domain-containing protein, partial [bacterium]|nr:T9SS type A sorting domain-containing protein [bacterium]
GYDLPYYGSGATMIVWGSATGFDNDPIANAGEDFSGFVDSLVTLDGTKSYDIDGDTLSFLWTQVSGTSVTLQTPTQPLCSFLNSGLVGEFLTFVLEVSSNTFVAFDTVKVEVLPTGLSENTNKTKNFRLSQNFPNPFNPNTTIVYELPNKAGKLLIFNAKGEKVREFLLEKKSGSVVWNGTDFSGKQVSSGIYFYRLETENGFSETKKMVLLK